MTIALADLLKRRPNVISYEALLSLRDAIRVDNAISGAGDPMVHGLTIVEQIEIEREVCRLCGESARRRGHRMAHLHGGDGQSRATVDYATWSRGLSFEARNRSCNAARPDNARGRSVVSFRASHPRLVSLLLVHLKRGLGRDAAIRSGRRCRR